MLNFKKLFNLNWEEVKLTTQIFLYTLFIVLPTLLVLTMCRGSKFWQWIGSFKIAKEMRIREKSRYEIWDHLMKTREMKAIGKRGFKTLGTIQSFLQDPYVNYQFLRETLAPEFNRYASPGEQIPLTLSERKMRKMIWQKAEEYYLTSDPLLEILAESFTAKTH